MTEMKKSNEGKKPRGCFIVLEGLDGSGKTTHAKTVRDYVEKTFSVKCELTREPGNGLGEQFRSFFLNHAGEIGTVTEALLLFADRNEHIEKVITPALDAGNWVVSERFIGSSYAYQGGREGSEDWGKIEALSHKFVNEKPALTIFLDISVPTAMKRIGSRKQKDRFEKKGEAYFKGIRNTFHVLSASSSWEHIDAERDRDEVRKEIEKVLDQHFAEHKK